MKKTIVHRIVLLAAGLAVAPASASDVGFGINLNISNLPPAPVAVPAPVYVPPPVVITQPPMFIAPPALGLSIAVGVPYDLFMVSGTYYVYKGNQWYCGSGYGGPWRPVASRRLPSPLRRHDVGHYRHVRDREYQAFNRDRDHYRGRYYQSGREGGSRRQEYAHGDKQVSWNQGYGERHNRESREYGHRN